MQTLVPGNPDQRANCRHPSAGFTLLELLVVLAIVAFASAGVGFALRDGTQTRLEREAIRLGALFEAARARSQVSGVPVRWVMNEQGFRFDGLPKSEQAEDDLPRNWLDPDTRASIDKPELPAAPDSDSAQSLLLGPDPIIEAQGVTLFSSSQPEQRVHLMTDGVRPFASQPPSP